MRQWILEHRAIGLVAAASLVAMIGGCGNEGQDQSSAANAGGEPPLVVTVSNGRSVQVGGSVFGPGKGTFHGPPPSRAGNRVRVLLGDPGMERIPVSMRATPEDSLVLVHVTASTTNDNTILIYGAYGSDMAKMIEDDAPAAQASLFGAAESRATKAGWECIWCRGGILACGVEPQCGR